MDIAMRAQKKLLGRMATKNVAKMFIDDISARILDNLHRFLKMNCASKKEAEKVVKNMIKVNTKRECESLLVITTVDFRLWLKWESLTRTELSTNLIWINWKTLKNYFEQLSLH